MTFKLIFDPLSLPLIQCRKPLSSGECFGALESKFDSNRLALARCFGALFDLGTKLDRF